MGRYLSKNKNRKLLLAYLEEEAEADPLVVLDVLLVPVVSRFVDSGMWHVIAHPLPVGGRECVSWVYPAVCVEHVFGDLPCVDTHDGRPDVLARRHDEGEGQQGHDGDPVVEAEHGAIGVISADLHQTFEP